MSDNPFAKFVYVEIDMDGIPSGWDNTDKRTVRKHVARTVGKQGRRLSHTNTWERKSVKTIFDDEGILVQTAGQVIYRFDSPLAGLVEKIYAEIAAALGHTIQAVMAKVNVIVLGNSSDARSHIKSNALIYGERV